MSITLLGALAMAVGLYGWLFSERVFIFVLAASAPFATSAGINFGENSVSPFHLVGALAFVSAITGHLRGARTDHPASKLLVALVAWAILITAFAPTIFADTPILAPRAGIDRQVYDPTPLAYSPSMAAQVAYLAVGVGVAVYFAQRKTLSVSMLTVPMFVGTVLSALRLIPALGEPMDAIFRNATSAGYMVWITRHFGVFAEPSYLSVFSVTALAFTVYRLRASKGVERAALFVVLILGSVNLIAATSGTGVVAFVFLVALGITYYGWRFLFAGMKLSPIWLLVPFLLAVALITPNPMTAAISEVIGDKSASDSFRNRFASDLFSVNLTVETFGLGVGLGASRPSSFATLVLSNLGLIGFILLVAVVWIALVRVRRSPEWLPAGVALFSLLLSKVLAEPALSTPLLWLLLGACMYAGKGAIPPKTQGKGAHRRHAARFANALNTGAT